LCPSALACSGTKTIAVTAMMNIAAEATTCVIRMHDMALLLGGGFLLTSHALPMGEVPYFLPYDAGAGHVSFTELLIVTLLTKSPRKE
jgi:hypothetical protein